MINYPCKGCLNRKPGCHAKCEEYQAAKQMDHERRQAAQADREANRLLSIGAGKRQGKYRRSVKRDLKLKGDF